MTIKSFQSLFLLVVFSCAVGCSGTFSGVFKPKEYKSLIIQPESLRTPPNAIPDVPIDKEPGLVDSIVKEVIVPVPEWWLLGDWAWYFTFGH